MQCYEGLESAQSIYEWNYQRQLISIRAAADDGISREQIEKHVFSKDFLLERPLLMSITQDKAPVLLIDEIDRADEEFEAFWQERLSDFQMSIPELVTIKAKHKPVVILTSSRTRDLSDALKRRCLYHWVDFPTFDKELAIVEKHVGGEVEILQHLVRFVEYLRAQHLQKIPGIAETIDWARALITLNATTLSPELIESTLGCVLKAQKDINEIKHSLTSILEETSA